VPKATHIQPVASHPGRRCVNSRCVGSVARNRLLARSVTIECDGPEEPRCASS
jgi:hypothetical protein